MLRAGVIIFLGTVVGWSFTHVVMLVNVWRRKPRRGLIVREVFSVFFDGGIGKDYMALLAEAHMQPTRFDRLLYTLDRIFKWSLVGSIFLLVIGFIAGS